MADNHTSPKSSRRTTPTSSRLWQIADGLLVVAALTSAVWACLPRSQDGTAALRQVVLLGEHQDGPDAIWYLDSTNVLHWKSGSADGTTGFAFALESVPENVQLLVHPDSLYGPLAGAVDVLSNAGADRIQVAVCEISPFSLE